MAGLVLAFVGGSTGPPAAAPAAVGPIAAASETESDATPSPSPSPACVPAPLEERAAQVLVAGLPGVLSADEQLAVELTELGVGGVLITKTNVTGEEQIGTLISGLRAASDTPLLVATDEEPGRVSSFGAVLGRSSSARTIAADQGPEGVREFALELAVDLRAFGVDLDLAPVADLDDGPAAGVIGDRSFSADAALAGPAALAYAEGVAEGGLLPTVKHWPGHGRSSTDSHTELEIVDVSLPELRATDLEPFQEVIDAGVPVVMLGHVGYTAFAPDLPASLAPAAYAELRNSGFTGVAMTDALGMGAVNTTWPFPEAAVMAIEAGADALLVTQGEAARSMRDALVDAVESGRVPEARLDEAVARVLALKGADPLTLTCTDATVPVMRVGSLGASPSPTAGDESEGEATPTPVAGPDDDVADDESPSATSHPAGPPALPPVGPSSRPSARPSESTGASQEPTDADATDEPTGPTPRPEAGADEESDGLPLELPDGGDG